MIYRKKITCFFHNTFIQIAATIERPVLKVFKSKTRTNWWIHKTNRFKFRDCLPNFYYRQCAKTTRLQFELILTWPSLPEIFSLLKGTYCNKVILPKKKKVYVCVCIYIYIYIYTYTHTHTHTHTILESNTKERKRSFRWTCPYDESITTYCCFPSSPLGMR